MNGVGKLSAFARPTRVIVSIQEAASCLRLLLRAFTHCVLRLLATELEFKIESVSGWKALS